MHVGEARDVVLVHGLWMAGVVMAPLAARLVRAGYRCHLFHYASHSRPVEANAEHLARYAERRIGDRPAHYVAHSLGGLVVLRALEAHRNLAVGAAVLLGTPARGSLAARRFQERRYGRWMIGASLPQWEEGRAAAWTRPEPLGVIAGSVPFGLARAWTRLPGSNDGVVRLEETSIDGMRQRIVLPVAHSEMIVSRRVADEVRAFLERGCFSAA